MKRNHSPVLRWASILACLPLVYSQLAWAQSSERPRSGTVSSEPSEPSAFAGDFRPAVWFGVGLGLTSDRDGDRTVYAPRVGAHYPFDELWRLDVLWPLALLVSPSGNIEDRMTGGLRADTVLRTGNPVVEVRRALVREPSGFDVDASLGLALPMASIEQPTPASGPDFERAPHTEATYRRALAAQGFREPWTYLWDTATLIGRAYVRQTTGPVVTDIQGTVGFAIPAGRLRADLGLVLTVSAYAGVDLWAAPTGDDRLQLGMRTDLGWTTPQRNEVDNELQIRGGQWAFAPELQFEWDSFFVNGSAVVSAGVDVDPYPDRAVWGIQLDSGARF